MDQQKTLYAKKWLKLQTVRTQFQMFHEYKKINHALAFILASSRIKLDLNFYALSDNAA